MLLVPQEIQNAKNISAGECKEENSGEDEGLPEEEINTFYQRYYMKLRGRGMQPKLAQPFATSLDGAASELSSCDSGSEA
ncbi:hypothetical protein V6N13_059487 [Hibiscus sabdariffa]|uniref:Uncharacterized protein n=1 Tax=Hibiscus sabdariffa TaxID=183260 RepID=A0ABR2GCY9_9ROSI